MNDLELLHSLNHAQGCYKRLHHRLVENNPVLSKKDVFGYGRILHILIKGGDMQQKELADKMDVRPQSLTSAMNRLEKNGYIERKRDKSDHRIQIVHVTEDGKEIGQMLHNIRRKAAKQYFACLDDNEKEELNRLLQKVEEADHD